MSDPGKAVFLSYASQDAEAATGICEALRGAGVEVWFDQSELAGGDAWDAKIRGQISSCALFMPVISANTQARREGYFRVEWKLAAQRTYAMSDDTAFVLPIVIDDTKDAGAKVPAEFKAVQWTRLRPAMRDHGGQARQESDDPALGRFVIRVQKLLEGEAMEAERPRPAAETHDQEPGTGNRRLGRLWWALPMFGVAMALLLVMKEGRKEPSPTSTPATPASLSEARKLVAQARALYENGDETNHETLSLAEDLLNKAQTLDSTDAEVWAAQAHVSRVMGLVGYDMSAARRSLLQKQAERAVKLDPDSLNAKIAYGMFLTDAGGNSALEGARQLQALEARHPREHFLLQAVGIAYSVAGKLDESIAAFDRANALPGGDARALAQKGAQLVWYGRYAEAEAALDESLAIQGNGRAYVFRTMMRLCWEGDLDAAAASLARWPAWLLLEPRGAMIASQVWLWRREPDKAIAILRAVPRDSWSDIFFTGPKPTLLALAHEMAGRTEAARADWENTIKVAGRMLAEDPMNTEALAYQACAQARLGDKAAAETMLHELEQAGGLRAQFWSCAPSSALLRLFAGRGDDVPVKFDTELRVPRIKGVFPSPQSALRLNPVFDPIRATPEFQQWLAGAPAPETKKADAASGPKAVAPDQKSVAVLAFANLSDDKANEYFSDGISEELLNVLAKIPNLKVAARTSAFYFKGKEVPVPEIAKQLGVAYVVEGSVRKAGDKVRITAQLIKAADGFHVWSDTFTRDLKDVFAVQDEIAGLIAKNLELKMGMVAARPTVDLEAYQEYLAGRALVAKAHNVELREAVRHFEKAVAIEPRFTAAWVQLASAHTQLGRWGGTPTRQAWAAARTAINAARALEPDSPDVLLALGWILRTADWDWRGAEQAYRRALELRPNHSDTLSAAAVLLFNVGRKEEALRLGRQAVALDPLNAATQIDLSLIFYFSEEFAEQEKLARRAIELAPAGDGYRGLLAYSLIGQRRFAEAEAEARREKDEVTRFSVLGMLAVEQGQVAAARDYRQQLKELYRRQGDTADLQLGIAVISAGLGDRDDAFAALEKIQSSRDAAVAWLRNDIFLRSLYADPRWDALLHKIGLADDPLK